MLFDYLKTYKDRSYSFIFPGDLFVIDAFERDKPKESLSSHGPRTPNAFTRQKELYATGTRMYFVASCGVFKRSFM